LLGVHTVNLSVIASTIGDSSRIVRIPPIVRSKCFLGGRCQGIASHSRLDTSFSNLKLAISGRDRPQLSGVNSLVAEYKLLIFDLSEVFSPLQSSVVGELS
jgi:hypothetical protein